MDVVPIHYDDTTNTFDDDGAISGIIPIKKLIKHKKQGGTYYYEDPDDEDRVYKVEFPYRELDRTMVYDSSTNLFEDEDGEIMYNIFSLITTNDLFMFKTNKKSVQIEGAQGGMITLIYHKGVLLC